MPDLNWKKKFKAAFEYHTHPHMTYLKAIEGKKAKTWKTL
jgi:hypothetical protein